MIPRFQVPNTAQSLQIYRKGAIEMAIVMCGVFLIALVAVSASAGVPDQLYIDHNVGGLLRKQTTHPRFFSWTPPHLKQVIRFDVCLN